MADDLYIGPTALAPGPSRRPDTIARFILLPLLVALLGIIGVLYVFFSPVLVVGDSMEPTLQHGDRLLVTKTYDEPERGDIVSITLRTRGGTEDAIKRIVALGGDTIVIREGVMYVNGQPEPTESRNLELNGRGEGVEMVVPPGSVFVLGDNRPTSLDSRFVGPISLDDVDGEFVFRILPLGKAGAIY